MGSSDSKLSAQAQAQQEEQYAIQMKNPAVAAAIEALEIDKATTGLKFYQLFAAMDKDGSKSIDLEEFHQFFELSHTTFSDLVFSNLGKQTPARGVTFDGSAHNAYFLGVPLAMTLILLCRLRIKPVELLHHVPSRHLYSRFSALRYAHAATNYYDDVGLTT
ncbi:hypothetical protein PHYSODRAFT_499595 [Phytophthora sojae]|uniref:EF-hand domain-containing protein n=1 Tax=Phytophthora sojae (strain P6497) TaxID=1094619 RepID=G4ZE57_PHYSP|nr:hypothetical protein PHYSODRAFT_499595 [Phytophthora sojae]EGZ17408.1 hypothetical protein PHYSODRAFT_499595 [Phytophthora sojae]|eukprot:XP_009526466.1 hypothetical protein PHYSODRAFT_499595 [Phytophthora sojae]